MPRNYTADPQGKRHLKPDSEALQKAISDVINKKVSVRKAATKHGINFSIVYRAVKKTKSGCPLKSLGGQCALSKIEEEGIVRCLKIAAEWRYPVDSYDLRLIIHQYLESVDKKIPRFRDNIPGIDFVYGFLRRHKDRLTNRMVENLKRARAKVSRADVIEYFKHLEKEIKGVPDTHIINYDKTNLSDNPGKKKCITKRGMKHPEQIINSSKSATSIIYAASASGTMLPLYVVYRSTECILPSWRMNGPRGTHYSRTKSGWFDGVCFLDWVVEVAVPYFCQFPKEDKKILIGDNLSSHLSKEAIDICLEWNIHFVFLLPNSTDKLQPLDVAFFRPLKGAWRKILTAWRISPEG